ncbi:hypothetical protein [Halegenticoccus tardaugens]|uniref:hypothetical protein n=1 Tax=Halegenticoccus tardaugens TaxID=2071624 RepID=UPI00100B7D01|nr:hypothetical protein [Halegenticoccus tardaugens]
MTQPTIHRQTPETRTKTETEPESQTAVDGDAETTVEGIIDEMIQSRIGELEAEIAALERQLEAVDNYTKISLNERKIKQSEENLLEFSDSLTGFAEKAFNDINEIEDRLDTQALLLASILEALDDEGVDVDLTAVERFQKENIVTGSGPEKRLEEAVNRL